MKFAIRSVDTLNFVAGATLRTGATIDAPLVCDGRELLTDVVTQTGAGAIPVTGRLVRLVTTGANALTLANGEEGQLLTIAMITDGGDGTLTPASRQGYATITFNDAGDVVTLLFTNARWFIVSNNGATVA